MLSRILLREAHASTERVCDRCSGKMHRVYMQSMLVEGWSCQFLEEDLKTPLLRNDQFFLPRGSGGSAGCGFAWRCSASLCLSPLQTYVPHIDMLSDFLRMKLEPSRDLAWLAVQQLQCQHFGIHGARSHSLSSIRVCASALRSGTVTRPAASTLLPDSWIRRHFERLQEVGKSPPARRAASVEGPPDSSVTAHRPQTQTETATAERSPNVRKTPATESKRS